MNIDFIEILNKTNNFKKKRKKRIIIEKINFILKKLKNF